MRPKAWLKSGAYLIIEKTEAMVVIDVNSGKFVGKSWKSLYHLALKEEYRFLSFVDAMFIERGG